MKKGLVYTHTYIKNSHKMESASNNDAIFNNVPDFGIALPAFRAGKKPHYVQMATPEAKRETLQRRRSSQSFGSSYGSFGDRERAEAEAAAAAAAPIDYNEREAEQQQQQQQQLFADMSDEDERMSVTSPPMSREGGLLLARAPSRDVWSSSLATREPMSSYTEMLPPSSHLLQHQRTPIMSGQLPPSRGKRRGGGGGGGVGGGGVGSDYRSHATSVALEKNAMLRHAKRLSIQKTSSSGGSGSGSASTGNARHGLLGRSNSMPKLDVDGGKNDTQEVPLNLNVVKEMKKRKRRHSTTDVTGTTVAGLIMELHEFYHMSTTNTTEEEEEEEEEEEDKKKKNDQSVPGNPIVLADMLQRESVRFHPAIVANVRMLYNTFTRQYGRGFGFGQYLILCRKLLMAVLGETAYKSLSRQEIFEELKEDWKDDAQNSTTLNFEQFWKAMYHLIDAWAPGKSASERIGAFLFLFLLFVHSFNNVISSSTSSHILSVFFFFLISLFLQQTGLILSYEKLCITIPLATRSW